MTLNNEFPGNSQRPRRTEPQQPREEKKVERIVAEGAIRRKKPLSTKMRETFVGGETKSVWEYVLLEVMVPAAKDMIADAASQGVERMIFGEARSTTRRGYSRSSGGFGPTGRVSYDRYSSPASNPVGRASGRDEARAPMSARARASHDFDEILIPTRAEADEVLEQLFELISKYRSASVADLYSLVGITSQYTDDKWGWYDLRGSGVSRQRQGYLLDLPKPEPLND